MRKMMWSAVVGAVLSVLCFTGCAPERVFRESDLTVQELEKKMERALDPQGRFARAKRFVQRFEVKVEKGLLEPPEEQFVEVKFAEPGSFKISTSDEEGLHYAYIFNDSQGYMVDYRKKSVKPLEKELLAHLRTMREIADPVMELESVFNFIETRRCTIGEKEYYRLRCRRQEKGTPLDLYVSAKDWKLERLEGVIKLGSARIDYKSSVINYALNEGIMVADLTESVANGVKTRSKLVYFKLDPYFSPEEFNVPVF
ncbi:MAG: hypothetical protein IJT50_02440 [Lentisphaeria bacterium]|nr:hypothetical protein [Lentisphaeria bacterium]